MRFSYLAERFGYREVPLDMTWLCDAEQPSTMDSNSAMALITLKTTSRLRSMFCSLNCAALPRSCESARMNSFMGEEFREEDVNGPQLLIGHNAIMVIGIGEA
jgi:hypothetical protein